MDLSLFATQVTGNKGPLSGGSSGLFGNGGLGSVGGLGNLNFLEAILGNLDADGEVRIKADNQNLQSDSSAETIKKEIGDLTLLQLALLGQDSDKTLEEKLAELKIERLNQTQENRVEQLTKLINHLTSGLPQEVDALAGSTIEDLVSRLNKRLENLEASLVAFRTGDFGDDNAPFKLLIATGLNPAQLTKITNRIEEVETKLGRELTVEDLIAGVGNIIPAPGTDTEGEFAATDALALLLRQQNANAANLKSNASNELDSKKNIKASDELDSLTENNGTTVQQPDLSNQNLIEFTITGEETASLDSAKSAQISAAPAPVIFHTRNDIRAMLNVIASEKIPPAGTPTTGLQPTGDNTILPEDGITELPENLSNSEFKALFGSKEIGDKGIQNAVAKMPFIDKLPDVAVPKMATSGDMMLPTNWTDSLLSQTALNDALGFDIQTGTPFTQTMQAVHNTTATQAAGQLHPGVAKVVAQITKAAQSGESRSMVLQLDPPELGRVEVRMEFGADNKIKAHMIVEKPETLLMLQRDSSALERALQNSGMETGSDSLNYEMAQENYGFGDDRKGGNNNSGMNSAKNNMEEDVEVIETTINWNVDPQTGHVRYNILA